MQNPQSNHQKRYKGPALDKDLDKISFVEGAAESLGRRLIGPGLGVVFMALCAVVAAFHVPAWSLSDTLVLAAAAAVGAYMAMNIGANDVANNVGPAVGARAITLTTALILAAFFESAGALLVGDDVLETVSSGIILPAHQVNSAVFTTAMIAALVAAALWINMATLIGAPVSTTHSVIGGVVGAGIAAGGWGAVNWSTMAAIAASWVASPVLGALVAASFLAFIRYMILDREDRLQAARFWLPVLIGLLVGAFTAYLTIKGLDRLLAVPHGFVFVTAPLLGGAAWLFTIPLIARQSAGFDNRRQSIRGLFTGPLMVAAALLSFAHGANDVANAVGPVAAIVNVQLAHTDTVAQAMETEPVTTVPLWVSAIGAFGISLGLMLFGPRLIRVVGQRITKLNPVRAFCVSLAAAITVLIASGLGLPVSSTYIAVGAVFGVGFFREWSWRRRQGEGASRLFNRSIRNREAHNSRLLVRRTYLLTIMTAWMVTVPISATIAAIVFELLRLVLGLS
ncbi:phosphate transporter [Roseibium aquae]|uniref:Phosphate transporter n=1 Tax=Roseibium aquae TaxID=1323746 RepID=A0A916X1L0_9HYPH|nr:inorganic phosphate transporter [Roseibium aquae]GGB54708.1 phosphate transporter [Roseibium aquae]